MHNEKTQPSKHSQWMAHSQPGGVDSHGFAWSKYLHVSAIAIETSNEVTGGCFFIILFMKQINTYQEYVSPYLRYYDILSG